jgi:uncharacterized protein YigE (DUF2233 family)
MIRVKIFVIATVFFIGGFSAYAIKHGQEDDRFITYIVDSRQQDVRLSWKDDRGSNFGSIQHLKSWLGKRKKNLVFSMNGGMYKPNGSPQGLFIENQKLFSPLDTSSGGGNFYLKPNGVFYITTDNKAVICKASDFIDKSKIKYATQSGPMLVIGGQIHPAFKEGSPNLNIRNGVGILPDGRVIFAMSKTGINFYDFARYFKNLGCKNALYLDGLVSRTYLPEKNWVQTDGNFGVIIGVVVDAK